VNGYFRGSTVEIQSSVCRLLADSVNILQSFG